LWGVVPEDRGFTADLRGGQGEAGESMESGIEIIERASRLRERPDSALFREQNPAAHATGSSFVVRSKGVPLDTGRHPASGAS